MVLLSIEPVLMKYLYMAPCACILRCLPYHQMSLCVGRLSRPWYEKKLLEHQLLKYYAIERRVCPNVVLHSNRLAVVKFLGGRRAGNLLDRHLKLVHLCFSEQPQIYNIDLSWLFYTVTERFFELHSCNMHRVLEHCEGSWSSAKRSHQGSGDGERHYPLP